ncbi:MAG: translocation/assembly module TamB domain-containing protein [Opitutales bacterium]|nr:translocation/assembly module TamB domain-containing protein [Opitutales bacterium]
MPWKILIRATAILCAFLVALILSLPIWLPWVAAPIAAGFGLTWENHSREGYHSLRLEEIAYQRDEVNITVDSLTFNQPLAWAWRVIGPGSTENPFATATGVFVEVLEPADPSPPPDRDPMSLNEIFDLVDGTMREVVRWAPVVELHDATVKVPGLEEPILVEQAKWNKGQLTTMASLRWMKESFTLQGNAHWAGGGHFSLLLNELERGAEANLKAERGSAVWEADLVLDWLENQVLLTTELAEEGQVPARVTLHAEDFDWPAELLQIPHYDNLTGSLRFLYEEENWKGESNLSLHGTSERFPPLDLELSGRGDWDEIHLEKLYFSAPWLTLELASPLTLTTTGEFVDPQTNLTGRASLDALPWIELEGEISLAIALATGRNPNDMEFSLAWESENLRWEDLVLGKFSGDLRGENRANTWEEFAQPENFTIRGKMKLEELILEELSLKEASLAGAVTWPAAEIETLSVETALGSKISLAGGVDWEKMKAEEIKGDLLVQAEEVREWLPDDFDFSSLNVTFGANGQWPELTHEISLEADKISVPQLKPAALQWQSEGIGPNLSAWSLNLRGDESDLTLSGELAQELSPWSLEVNLDQFSLHDKVKGWTLALDDRARITVRQEDDLPFPVVGIDNLNFSKTGDAVDGLLALQGQLSWPDSGDLRLHTENITPFMANSLLRDPLPDPGLFEFPENRLEIHWNNGPLEIDWQKTLVTLLPNAPSLTSHWAITAGAEGVRLNQWEIVDQEEELMMAEGIFPVSFHPSGLPHDFLQIDFTAPLRWKAESSGEASFWRHLVNLSDIELKNPRVKSDISGTLRNPEGLLTATFDSFRYLPSDQENAQQYPAVENFVAEVQLSRQMAEIRELRFTAEKQEVLMNANLPLGDRQWERFLTTGEPPDWRQLDAVLKIPGAEIAAFSPYFPEIISPQGELSAEIRLRPGLEPAGKISLRGASTRPMLPLGALSNINGDLLLENRQIRIENLGGRLGGQRIRIDGQVDYEEDQSWTYGATLRGEKLPIVRQPGMILRTDLNLALNGSTRPGDNTVISGDVNLRDSFFLQEVRFQAPGSVTSPAMRPPFFSVDIDPVGDWVLDLNITGREFITVRSAVFNGVVNAGLRLQNTLREPQAIGQVDVARGTIRFPFASLRVQEAIVRLTEENPFVPELYAQAQGRVFGYDITLDLTGTSVEPIIEFSSTPPLSSEEILLMITAGEVPEREIVFTGRQRAGRLAMFLGQNILYEITGQDDAGDRLSIESGNNISRQGRETFIIEYLLTDRLSAVGEYDEYDAVNAGIKWKLFSR